MRRLLIAGTAAAAAAAVLGLGGVFRSGGSSAAAPAAPASLGSGFASANTAALVTRLQDELRDAPANSFAVRSRRREKTFPVSSMELARVVGAAVREELGLRVDLSTPDIELRVEAYERERGDIAPGGEGA